MCDEATIKYMMETVRAINTGDFLRRVKVSSADNLGRLGMEINALAERHQIAQETILGLNQQVKRNNREAIMALVEALSAKDPYTRGHSERVSMYSLLLSEKLGLLDEEIDGVYIASYLHDVGKIGIPEDILNKPGKLTGSEYEQIKTHAQISSQIVSQIPNLSHIAYMIKHHHERYDGKGYPDGLDGTEIPLGSRILAIADAFDAMTSTRSYRVPHSLQDALFEVKRCSGSQFDPELSDIFVDACSGDYGEFIIGMGMSASL